MVQSLSGKYIVDIACGGFHSAAISRYGHLYTWGKGRYGRLGHGDYEDYLYPKFVRKLSVISFRLKSNFKCNKIFFELSV